jgi:hypothetical protein
MKALLVLGLVASAVSAAVLSASAGTNTRPPFGVEPLGSAEWPSVAAQLAKNIAKDSFAHNYAKVWGYLHPTYQHAISQSSWNKCQRSHPSVPSNDVITKVSVANATELAVNLSLLGRRNLQEIQLVVRFNTPAAAGPQLALLYTFWLKEGTTWRAVWLSDEYQAYKAGTCYLTPQGPPLY